LYEYLEESFVATKGAKFTRGKVLQFAITHKCRELISEIQPQDNKSSIRTIHKAKGAEYPVVLIVLKQEKELDNILRPSLNSVDDESRIYYVALSRAKDKIIISVPSLNKRRELQSKSLGFEVERLTEK
jgi:DNA helicase-2/ATP-dependent DNA helicase PcrA